MFLSDVAKYEALKENFKVIIIDFNGAQFKQEWSCQGVKYSANELTDHLKWMIGDEKPLKTSKQPTITIHLRNHSLYLKHDNVDGCGLFMDEFEWSGILVDHVMFYGTNQSKIHLKSRIVINNDRNSKNVLLSILKF